MVPDYQTLMLPVLRHSAETAISTRELLRRITSTFSLTDQDLNQRLPSGKKTVLHDRISWAKTYLKQAGLIEYPERGYSLATEEGRRVLAQGQERIDNSFLYQYHSFQAFLARRSDNPSAKSMTGDEANRPLTGTVVETPDEALRDAHRNMTNALAAELLDRVRSAPPAFLESLLIELLAKMGYGGTSEAGSLDGSAPAIGKLVLGKWALGRSGDGGLDGVIDQDPLGVDQVYIQAKRYAERNTVGSPAIRDFYGALNLVKARKGIFFTTSDFTADAVKTAKGLDARIVLINGHRLANLMVTYNIGCREEEVLVLKKIDEDFFEQ